jgi:hypothetical protein
MDSGPAWSQEAFKSKITLRIYIMSHCCHTAITPGSTEFQICKGKCKYGPYCYKHRSYHLITDGYIDIDRFTGLSKDYLVNDMSLFLRRYKGFLGNVSSVYGQPRRNKADLFEMVRKVIETLKHYESPFSLPALLMVQSMIRMKLVLMTQAKFRCNNQEDFFTFDPLREIPIKYYYSYVDPRGHRWGFDIRSLKKLLDMKYANPYTTEAFPPEVVRDVMKCYRRLARSESYEDIVDEVARSRQEEIKQRVVDIFSAIERSGYTCSVDWFMSLTRARLRELYRNFEDIWNYRSELSEERKREIISPDGRLCTTPVTQVMNTTDKGVLQSLITEEVSKFLVTPNEGDRKLGFMYFIISLGQVSQECFDAHGWWLAGV